MPPGYARPAEVRAAASVGFLRGRSLRAAARARHRPARTPERGQPALHGQGERPRQRRRGCVPVPDHGRHARARPGAFQHLLLAVPRPHGPGRRNGGAPRLPASADLSPGPAAVRRRRPFLRCHHERLRRDARLRRADSRRGSLEHRGVREGAAAERTRDNRRRAGRGTGEAAVTRPAEIRETADQAIPELAGLQQRFLIAGGIGAVLAAIGAFLNPTQFLQSYLMAYMLWIGVTLGCFALGMVHQLSGGAWGVVIRREIGAAARVLPIMTVLFLPIVIGMNRLYPWTDAALVAKDEALQHKHLYLNTPFFLARAAFYFIVWNGVSYLLNAW